jgi:hypothetical protein
MPRDPLARLRELAEVSPALRRARIAVDGSYRRLGTGTRISAEARLRAAVASAALAGGRYELAAVRTGTITDPVLNGALRCAEELPDLVEWWRLAPRQALARLHLLAARGSVDEASLGRPDPAAVERLDVLVDVVLAGAEPGLLRAAVVHGELLAVRAFPGPYGVVARAAARLELVSSGFDPYGLVPIEVGHLAREPEYLGCAGTFATGTPDGVRAWLRHCATAVELGAAALTRLGQS